MIKLTDRFKNDLIIFFKRLYILIFTIAIWYSLAMFQIETLNISIFGEDNLKSYVAMIGVLLELIVLLITLAIFTSIFITISDSIKYMFVIEPKYRKMDIVEKDNIFKNIEDDDPKVTMNVIIEETIKRRSKLKPTYK